RLRDARARARPAHVPEARPVPGEAPARHRQPHGERMAPGPEPPHRGSDPGRSMNPSVASMGRAAVACALTLALGALPAEAGRRRPVAAPAPDQPWADAPAGTPLATPAKLPLARTPVEPRRLALTRAALEHARGNDAAVVAILEPLGMERAAAFPDA